MRKLKKKFLEILRDNNGRWSYYLQNGLEHKIGVSREKMLHVAHLLENDGLIMVRGMEVPTQAIYEITSGGYDFLNPLKKTWKVFAYYISPIIVIILTILQIMQLIKNK